MLQIKMIVVENMSGHSRPKSSFPRPNLPKIRRSVSRLSLTEKPAEQRILVDDIGPRKPGPYSMPLPGKCKRYFQLQINFDSCSLKLYFPSQYFQMLPTS